MNDQYTKKFQCKFSGSLMTAILIASLTTSSLLAMRDPFSMGANAAAKPNDAGSKFRLISIICPAVDAQQCYAGIAVIKSGQKSYAVQQNEIVLGWRVTAILDDHVVLTKDNDRSISKKLALG